ncbi:MAG: hypothetical protein ISS16_08745 [Ignavibacteria bacterium]|nr:hypothetical protein [Ignavibacteria bacterium]
MKIIYLFGAGASCNCLPIINQIPDRIIKLIKFLNKSTFIFSKDEKFDNISDKSKTEIKEMLISDLEWLANESSKHASIDTFAKKLFLKNKHNELLKLRLELSVFFIIEQLRYKPDDRYDFFYASILNKRITSFPNNINIVSWNYDYQFEISFMDYSEVYTLSESNARLNVISKNIDDNADPNSFAIYKLNGTTALCSVDGFKQYPFINIYKSQMDKSTLEDIIKRYAEGLYLKDRVYSGVSFAWEGERGLSIAGKALGAMSKGEVLVVIGYSFPFFNREIDRILIKSMDKLKKVYIQDPHAEIVAERFKATKGDLEEIPIICIHDTEQFLLPDEL